MLFEQPGTRYRWRGSGRVALWPFRPVQPRPWRRPGEVGMGDTRGAREFRAGVIRCSRRQVPEEPLALAQQYWRYRQVHLVDEPGVKELPGGGGGAAEGGGPALRATSWPLAARVAMSSTSGGVASTKRNVVPLRMARSARG